VTHEELRTSIDAWALGALPEAEARQVEDHLAKCAECQADARTASAVATGLAGMGIWAWSFVIDMGDRQQRPQPRGRMITGHPVREMS